MVINKNLYSLEFWAQEQYLRNTDGSINTGAMSQAWPNQSKSKFQAQLEDAGYKELPKALLKEEAVLITKEQFLDLYEFGTPVREYILMAAKAGLKLERQTLFEWVKLMSPQKVNYGRNYSQVGN